MEKRVFHYTKIGGVVLFICYLFILAFSLWGFIICYNNVWDLLLFAVPVSICFLFLSYIYRSWLKPAFLNEFVFELDDRTLTVKKYPPIPWGNIASLYFRHGQYGNVIGVRLCNFDEFREKVPGKLNRIGLAFNIKRYGFHIGVSSTLIKERGAYEVINEYFQRLGKTNK